MTISDYIEIYKIDPVDYNYLLLTLSDQNNTRQGCRSMTLSSVGGNTQRSQLAQFWRVNRTDRFNFVCRSRGYFYCFYENNITNICYFPPFIIFLHKHFLFCVLMNIWKKVWELIACEIVKVLDFIPLQNSVLGCCGI